MQLDEFAVITTKRVFRDISAFLKAFITDIDCFALPAHQKVLFYCERSCLVQVSAAGYAGMVQHLANPQSIYPVVETISAATEIVAEIDDANKDKQKGDA